ncbi:hypothetical protein [Odoribacter sp. AF15-53]|uniref:hypothetical protein n=1 Tax=Odoribacter sp. AF15-53 TaxID=2292236 RepID=UPI000E5550BD|nr:hypothetical protein [Odoribacter sp. AF15-53]RHR79853.1 hypothetical protein DWW52_09830 [Odoribacter sp. AF15-53]
MEKNIYFLIFICFSILYGCTDKQDGQQVQDNETILKYDGSNSIAHSFIKKIEENETNLNDILSNSKILLFDYAMRGFNSSNELFYAIPIQDTGLDSISEYLMMKLDAVNEPIENEGYKGLLVVNKDFVLSASLSQDINAVLVFLMWKDGGLDIDSELYNLILKLNFKKGNQINSRSFENYGSYTCDVNFEIDYSFMYGESVKGKKVSWYELRSAYDKAERWVLTHDDNYRERVGHINVSIDTNRFYFLISAPQFSGPEEVESMVNAIMWDVEYNLNVKYAGINLNILYMITTGHGPNSGSGSGSNPGTNPGDSYPPIIPWEPAKPGFPEDNQLDIHRRILRVGFRGSKAFQDSLFKGDSLADSREYRSLGKSYIHALVEPGQTKAQVQSAMGEFFREQMDLYFENGNVVHLGMALHPIIDSYCLGHDKKYWFDNQWHTDVIHCFEETFKLYGNEDAAISALEVLFQYVMVEGQRDVYALFNQWLYSSYYGPLNPYNIKY